MTDRVKGYVVTLDGTYREDDAEAILNAIRMVKGVRRVEPVPSRGVDDAIVRSRVLLEIREAVCKAIDGVEA
jgi:hypothetical protein